MPANADGDGHFLVPGLWRYRCARMSEFPPHLVDGDRVALIAPSSPFDDRDLRAAVERLEGRFAVAFGADVTARDDYLAGSDGRRAAELQAVLDDPSVRAVIAVRGGFGAGRIARLLDAARFRDAPKWLVGFSDITVLHAWAQSQGVASLHGPNAGGIGRSASEADAVVSVLTGVRTSSTWSVRAIEPFAPVAGRAAGGNLTVLVHEALAGRCPSMRDRVLFLEDVGERVYRIDRMLAALVDGGHLDGVRGVVFGHFTRCEGTPGGRGLERVARDLCDRLAVPVVLGAPFGHEEPNEPFVQGARVSVSTAEVVVAYGP
jgi:muramoyltetrapeptide carboxypeptidase